MSQPEKVVLTVRRLLLALIMFGLLGLGGELLLLGHHEDFWQWLPLVLIAVALVAIAVHALRPGVASIRILQTTMTFFVVAGLVGVALHYRASLEFQLESGTVPRGWPLFWKALQAKAPPPLAPGFMAQLGLLGLIYAHRQAEVFRASPKAETRAV